MTIARHGPSRQVLVRPAAGTWLAADEVRVLDPAAIAIERRRAGHRVVRHEGGEAVMALVGEDRPAAGGRPRTIEVVVHGWRFELEVEDADLAALRERARRGRIDPVGSRRLEIRAMIPGRVAAVTVATGDAVTAGQALLVVEAMKMQNEVRAPRDGRIEGIATGVGETIDLGDVLVVLE